jgi:hypothetical protein
MNFADFQSELLNHEMLLESQHSTPSQQLKPTRLLFTPTSQDSQVASTKVPPISAKPNIRQGPTFSLNTSPPETSLQTNLMLLGITLAFPSETIFLQINKPLC